MRTSEALRQMYDRMYPGSFPPPGVDISELYNQLGRMFAQASGQAETQLGTLMFKVPADVIRRHATDPEEAQKMLTRAIVGCQVWEEIIEIENGAPTEEEWSNYLDQSGFWQMFPDLG